MEGVHPGDHRMAVQEVSVNVLLGSSGVGVVNVVGGQATPFVQDLLGRPSVDSEMFHGPFGIDCVRPAVISPVVSQDARIVAEPGRRDAERR
jgi:hypothetical protein